MTARKPDALFLLTEDAKVARCAARTFERTCERSDPWGCTMYARELITGEHLPRDFDKARTAIARACQRDRSDPACSAAEQMKSLLDKAPNSGRAPQAGRLPARGGFPRYLG